MLVCLTLPACALAARLSASVHGSDGKPLPNAVVVAVPEDGRLPALTKTMEVVDQIDKELVPYVKAVRAGSYVQFRTRTTSGITFTRSLRRRNSNFLCTAEHRPNPCCSTSRGS